MTIIEPAEFGLKAAVPAEVFVPHQDAAFWVGRIATGEAVENQDIYDGLMRFRGNVYIRELHFLPEDHLDAKGREMDADDKRSIEFVVLERTGLNGSSEASVVGSARLIVKSEESEELPIEHYFSELFEDQAAQSGSVEISRFIARHPDRQTQSAIMLSLIRAITLYSVNNQINTQYFMIEEPLVQKFNRLGVPQVLLAQPKDVPKYSGILYPVRLNPNELYKAVMAENTGALLLRTYFEATASDTGEGFYDRSFLETHRD